jgi:chorismate dehydratase
VERPLIVGEIAYANVLPLFDAWRATAGVGPDGSPPGVRIVRGDPATLNAALRTGEIDAAPCSSIEYARDPAGYRLLPDLSITADGPVESVLLFTRRPLGSLDGSGLPAVALSPASATSTVLVRLLFAERHLAARFVESPGAALPVAAEGQLDAALVIGDDALLAAADGAARARAAGFHHVYDLGLLWRELTGLPFVFALWIVRREAAEGAPAAVARLAADLAAARAAVPARLAALAAREQGLSGLSAGQLLAYWQRIRYDLGARACEGLMTYYRLAVRHGLLQAAPPLRFA